ncbi:MAG: hypothetical protein ACW98U_05465 [Candidatus Thorarchaeota archaeon]|jgi:hypothetical protein
MRATKSKVMTLWVLILLIMPFVLIPNADAWTEGDEAAVFGHTFAEEYWTNDSIRVEGADGTNSSFTASYVSSGDFASFLIAFNNANKTDGTQMILPYQLFGMYFKTPANREVFIGAIFAFLLVNNDTYNPTDNLPDVGNEPAWYVVPLASDNTWPEYTPSVEPIPATKISDTHYRMGMRYHNLTCRIVDANNPVGFWLSLGIPILNVVISELTIQYDITIDETGQVHAETLYTIGQVKELKLWGVELPPTDVIGDQFEISAVHYLSIFTSQYTVTSATTGNTIDPPTSTQLLDEDISIKVGENERAFDIGLGREYSLVNETTEPWTTVSNDETALNCLVGARLSDLFLVAWQAPLSAVLFAHMAYGLSSKLQTDYPSVGAMAAATVAGTAFHNSQWWYAVTFPEWDGLRIEQDPVYTAYTNLYAPDNSGGGGIILIAGLVVGVIAIVWIIRRR